MMKQIVAAAAGLCVAVGTAAAGGGAGPRGNGAPPPFAAPPVLNEVRDLFDGELLLETETERDRWVSPPFDTSRFNRIGLRVAGETEPFNFLFCVTQWQFAPDDDFAGAHPAAATRILPVLQRPGVPSFFPPSDFAEVRGLQARVVCAPGRTDIGRDPTGLPPASGVLTDVKVLLRRD